MYIDYKELNSCTGCGQKPEKLFQMNAGPIIGVQCRCCWRGANGSTWDEVRDDIGLALESDEIRITKSSGLYGKMMYECNLPKYDLYVIGYSTEELKKKIKRELKWNQKKRLKKCLSLDE